MNRTLDILARTASLVLYPMWMPTLGMLLYAANLASTSMMPALAWRYGLILALTTLVITAFIPIMWMMYLVRSGRIDSLYLDRPEQRGMPYLIATVAYASWCYILWSTLHVAPPVLWSSIGATVALALVAAINTRWKISAHTTGIGGLVGGVIGYSLTADCPSAVPTVTVLMLLSLVSMYARLYLDKHTDGQVVAGWLLGLLCTLLPAAFAF